MAGNKTVATDANVAGFIGALEDERQRADSEVLIGLYDEILVRLGEHKTGKSCLYITRLSNVDIDVLRELMIASVAWVREKWPTS
ncbi:MAG: hypothetical protein ACI81R_003801 [Bradymonadia bacterium]|jgi:hypothetical protein